MLKERIISAFFISIVLIFVFGFMKPEPDRSIFEEKWFWVWKTHSNNLYDVVILGDSRIYRAVSPENMEDILIGYRILNFGYSSGSLDELMLSEAEKKLDSTGKRIIILGISPNTLTQRAARDEHYLQEKNRDKWEIIKILYFGHLTNFFTPTTPIELFKNTNPSFPIYHQEFHKSGWVASWKEPENPKEALISYADAFRNEQISLEIENNLIMKTQYWVKQGVRVFAFRPPTCQEMEDLENTLSGFNEQQFIEKFSEAGGTWLPISSHDYHSYDGSHIDKESAIRLSILLADKMKN